MIVFSISCWIVSAIYAIAIVIGSFIFIGIIYGAQLLIVEYLPPVTTDAYNISTLVKVD